MSVLLYLSCFVIFGSTIVSGQDYEEFDKDVVDSTVRTSYHGWDGGRLPGFFDARKKWSNICPQIGKMKNQGTCRSGWAMAIASVISDRRCIKSHGDIKKSLSAMMLLSCCPNCCGCYNGHVLNAWKYTRDVGLVTGSLQANINKLRLEDGCQPYLIKPLSKNDLLRSSTQFAQTPVCFNSKCTNPLLKWNEDKLLRFKIHSFELLSINDQEKIMKELIKNGPLQVSFRLFEDFRNYTSDDPEMVYVHTWGRQDGTHAAKLIGWGTTKYKVKYWLLMNSFGYFWGNNGTFKIHRSDIRNGDFLYAVVAPAVDSGSAVTVGIPPRWTLIIIVVHIVCAISITNFL